LDEYTAMAAAYHNLAKRLAARGMDALAVEWNERALNTATKFGLDRLYLQELTDDLMVSREAATVAGKESSAAPAEVMVGGGGFLNGDAASQLSMSPTSHFASSPNPNSAYMRGAEEAYPFATGDFYNSIGSGIDDDEEPAVLAAAAETQWLPTDQDTSGRPRERARPKSAIPNPTPNRRVMASGSDRALYFYEDDITPPDDRKSMEIHTAMQDLEDMGAPPSTRSRPKSAVSKLGGGYTPLGGSNEALGVGDRAAMHNHDAAGRVDAQDTRHAFFSGDGAGVWEGAYVEPSRDKNGHNKSSSTIGVVTMGVAAVAQELQKQGRGRGRGGIVTFFGNNSTKPMKLSRSSSGGVNVGVSTNDRRSAKRDIDAVQLFSAEVSRGHPQVPPPASVRNRSTNAKSRSPNAKSRSPNAKSLSASLAAASPELTAEELLELVESHENENEDVDRDILRGVRRSPGKNSSTKAGGANHRLQTGPIHQETVHAHKLRVADTQGRTKKRTDLAKKHTFARLEEDRKQLELERMRLTAERERQQEAIDAEKRRLDAARMELARLHEKRMSVILTERNAAQQQVEVLARTLEAERTTTKETLLRERERGEKSVKKERMKLELDLAERLKAEMDTLRRADESRAALFLQQQQELATLLKPFHVGMNVEVEVPLNERLGANLDAERSDIWRLAVVTDTLPGLIFDVEYLDGAVGAREDVEQHVPFSRLRRPVSVTPVSAAPPVTQPIEKEPELNQNIDEVPEFEVSVEKEPESAAEEENVELQQLEEEAKAGASREELNQRRQDFVANVLIDASNRTEGRSKQRQSVRVHAATTLQRLARGVAVRANAQLRSHLARAHVLRKREQSLLSAQKELDRKAADAEHRVATNSLLQRQHEEIMRSLEDMRAVEGRAVAAGLHAVPETANSDALEPPFVPSAVVNKLVVSTAQSAKPTQSLPTPVEETNGAEHAPAPGSHMEAEALDAEDGYVVDLGDSHDHLSAFTAQSIESSVLQATEGKSQKANSDTLAYDLGHRGSGRAPSPPRPFSRGANKPRTPRAAGEPYEPSDAVRQQILLVDELEEGLEEESHFEELSAAYVRMSNLYYQEGAVIEAIESREKALAVFPLALPEVKVGILNFLIRMAGDINDSVAVEQFYRRAIETKYLISTKIAAVKRKRNARNNKPQAEAQERYRPSSRVLHDEGAIDRIRGIKSPETPMKLLEAYTQLAGNYFREGGATEAMSTYEKALAILQTTGVASSPALAVTIFGSLGVLARQSKALEKAQWCFSEMIAAGQLVAQLASRDSAALGTSSSETITEFAVYTVHCADLLRERGEFSKASALLEDACDVLDANIGSDHVVSRVAHRCLVMAELGAAHVVPEFAALSLDLLYADTTSDATVAQNVPAVETTDPAYVQKEAALQHILAVLATDPKKLSSEQGSGEAKDETHGRNYLRWRDHFNNIVDLNALRATCCHLLDPLCAIAITIFSTDSQLQTTIYRGKTGDSTFFTNFQSKGLAPEMVYPILSSSAPSLGAGPTDTDWPDILDITRPVEGGTVMNLDAPSEISLDAQSNGSTLFRSMTEANKFLPAQYNRNVSRNFTENSDFLGNRAAFSLPIFSLKETSLQRRNNSQDALGALAAPICVDVNINDGKNEADGSSLGKTKNEVAWTVSLPESTLVKLATSGEWISFCLTDPVEKPRLLWIRASILHIGNIIDRFSQLWAVHAQWAAHHMMATAALEELICDSINEGTKLTRKAPGGGLQTYELDGYDAKPQRGLLPTQPSGNEAVRLMSRKAPIVQPSAPFSPGASMASGFSNDFADSTEHEHSTIHDFNREDHDKVNSRVAELEFVLGASRRTYAACQADLIRSQAGLRRCMRQWELDSRRQRSMMRPVTEEEPTLHNSRNTTESIVSRRLSEISASVYEMLSEASIGARDINNRSRKGLIIGISSWEQVRVALWEHTEGQLMQCLEVMCEATGLQIAPGTFTAATQAQENMHLDVRNIAHVACQVALYSAVDKIMSFHWRNWRKKAATWNSFISHNELNAIVDECETIMYAPVPRSFLQQATSGAAQEVSSEHNLNIAEKETDARAKAHARKAALDALPQVRFQPNSPALRLIQKAIQAHVRALSSPRSNLQLRMQGATESCAQQ